MTIIQNALIEDVTDPSGKIPPGDHSSLACIPAASQKMAVLKAKEEGVIAGLEVAILTFLEVDPGIELEKLKEDGDRVRPGDEILKISGDAQSLLRAERVALNFMQRMSGTATLTRKFVDEVKGTGTVILDTRKTTPNLRPLEKWAVRIGGGQNHRYGLFDMVMLKDNHIDFAGGIPQALKRTSDYLEKLGHQLPIEVETRNLDEVRQVLDTGIATRIMLDNFSKEDVKRAVELIDRRMETEVSGGINLNTVRGYAECGPDFISVGALTHSAGSLDISMTARA